MNNQTVVSKFKLPMTFGVLGITLILIGLLSWIAYVWFIDLEEIGMFQRVMLTFFPLLVIPLVFKIEIPKIKKLEISEKGIVISDPIFGRTTRLVWKDFEGYQTVIHFTRDGPLKELMLIADNKVIHEVSENYIKNYSQVKRAITRNINNLGPIDFSYFEYIKKRLFR